MCVRLLLKIMALIGGIFAVSDVSAQDFCANPTKSCRDGLAPECLDRIGAGALPTGQAVQQTTGCLEVFEAYRACLSRAVLECRPGTTARLPASTQPSTTENASTDDATMLAIWNEIKDSGDIASLESFASAYDGKPLAALARSRAASLRSGEEGGSPTGQARPEVAGAEAARTGEASQSEPLDDPEEITNKLKALQQLLAIMEGDGSGLQGSDAAVSPQAEQQANAAVIEVVAIINKYSGCSDQAGDLESKAVFEKLFIKGVDDPLIDQKLAISTQIDDAILVHMIQSGDVLGDCVARLIEGLSTVSPEVLIVLTELLDAVEILTIDAVEDRPTVGHMNLQFKNSVEGFQNSLGVALQVMQLRIRAGLSVPEDTRVRAEDLLEDWGDLREELHDTFPSNLGVKPPPVVRCRWAGEAMRCTY